MNGYAALILLFAFLAGCQKGESEQPLPFLSINAPIAQTACYETRPVIRQAKNLVGRVSQTQGQNLYSINYSVPGTYDSVWVGFTCNLPDEYKVAGREVIFSGEYRPGPEGPTTFAGQETYYLFLTSIRAK